MSLGFIPPTFKEPLLDQYGFATEQVLRSKTAEMRIEYGKIKRYYPFTNSADVELTSGAGAGGSIHVKSLIQYLGPAPGTGDAASYWLGQGVRIAFTGGSATGLFNQGFIIGTLSTHKDNHAPAYAPWLQSGTGTVRVYPTTDGKWGNAEHVDGQSNVSRTTVAKVNHEDWGNKHTVVNGPNVTRAEELTRRASDGHSAAASRLGVQL